MNDEALETPPKTTLEDTLYRDSFLLEGPEANVWFKLRSRTALVTFDNLATVEYPEPRQPWLHQRAEALGYSLVGIQSFKKDWYRQQTAPRRIKELYDLGFFDRFDRIVFTGASMGAFAALNFAPLVPGSSVLAFSPQSTMSKQIAPFENRFGRPVRVTDWVNTPFLDAAAAVPYIRKVAIAYDPFVAEDRQHAIRLSGPNVQHLKCNHFSHQCIRYIIKCGALENLIQDFAENDHVGPRFWGDLQNRKSVRAWKRTFIGDLVASKHNRLTLQACDYLLKEEPYMFATRAKAEMEARQKSGVSEINPLP